MKNEILPIGSVVLLKEATRKIVIIGYGAIEKGQTKIWDYLGCAYPIGVINSETNLLFDKEQIDKVFYKGYSDLEGDKFRENLRVSLEKLTK